MTTRRIISSDSHVSVQHDDVKAHLASRFHDDYDAALAQAFREMLGGNAAKANAGGTEIRHASWGRPGYCDPHERLRDMDTDGVDIEVLYCEVSAYRYLYLLQQRRDRGHPRVQRHACTTSRRPTRAGSSSPTRCRSTTSTSRSAEIERVASLRRQVAAAPGVPRRARPARLLPRALRPHVGGDPGERAADLLPHRPQHRARQPRRPRPDPAPRAGRSRACRRRRAKRSACGCSPASSPATRS